MDIKKLEKIFNSKPHSTKEFPFGPDVLVIKVIGKMYAIIAINNSPLRVSLKCDPEDAKMLRQQYEAVNPGYHLNKKHWNTVTLDGTIPVSDVKKMIDQSYALVIEKLKKSDRDLIST